MEFAGVLLGEERFEVVGIKESVAGADVDSATGNGGAGPNGAEVDLFEQGTVIGIQGDELAAGDGGEVDNPIGEGDAGSDGVADVGEDRFGLGAAYGGEKWAFVTPVFGFGIDFKCSDSPACGWHTAHQLHLLRSQFEGIDAIGVDAFSIGRAPGLQAAHDAGEGKHTSVRSWLQADIWVKPV